MSRVWPVNILFRIWDRCLFFLVDSRLKISLEKKSRQIQAESSDFILNPDITLICQKEAGVPRFYENNARLRFRKTHLRSAVFLDPICKMRLITACSKHV